MKRPSANNAFALAVTLVMMALVIIVVLAYLANTRTDRATSSIYANKLRAQVIAEGGLAAATQLLRDNTRYGNYVTAMPPPVPTPAFIYTEIYRPTDIADKTTAKSNDYLTLGNASGDVLVSLAGTTASSQIDPRPTPAMVYVSPSPTPLPAFALPTPALSEEKLPPAVSPTPSGNSYNFNQTVRIGTNTSGRLVDPSGRLALGQWVRVRSNTTPQELVGRYAFFIEDESMKVNVNATGNNIGSPNLRVNDLAPIPGATPVSQIQEIDPTSVLPAADRAQANASLVSLGLPGQRSPSKGTTGLLSKWDAIEKYYHLLTAVSEDDNTTARGWQRMDLNKVVADAEALGTPSAKTAAAAKIADWIRDAWTGPTPLANLQYSQLFKDDRLRTQIAANIVDYIDQDNIPTDMGDLIPVDDSGMPLPEAIPVLGIERIPLLVGVHVLYEASGGTFPGTGVGNFTATLKMKLEFRFLNLFDSDLDIANYIGSIEIQGVPSITKNGFDVFPTPSPAPSPAKLYTIQLSDLTPVNPSPTPLPATVTTVPAGIDGNSDSGARSFQTDWLESQLVTFTVSANDAKPRFVAGKLIVRILGKTNERIDNTALALTPNPSGTGYDPPSSGNDSVGDFLKDSTTTPRQIASINLTYGQAGTATLDFGDPRFRSRLITDRWRNLLRTDKQRVDDSVDKAEASVRTYAFDWYDHVSSRPLSFIRNKGLVNIGELGQVSAAEYPWRSIYLQQPERPANTTQPGPLTDIPQRRSQSQDGDLVDIFRAGGNINRVGAININTQLSYLPSGATNSIFPLQSLFLGIPVSAPASTPTPSPAPSPQLFAQSPSTQPAADRVSTGVNQLVNTVLPSGSPAAKYRVSSISNKRTALAMESPTIDNTPTRPFFQIADLAPALARLVCSTETSSTGTPARSTVTYSALRVTPTTKSEANYFIRRDMQVEQPFREVSNSITTRGNVFRILYVGQSIKDQKDSSGILGRVETSNEITSEYLGEIYVRRVSIFQPDTSINPDVVRVIGSNYQIISQRVISE